MADEETNEILEAARAAKARKDGAAGNEAEAKRKRWSLGKLGLGIGIGSAAVAAAVLFTNRDSGKKS